MNVLLISTYELGRQPFGLASPAAWLEREGHRVTCVDTSVSRLEASTIAEADLVAFHLPMHTATRLATAAIAKVRAINPRAHLCCYGLYAPSNESLLRRLGVRTILGGEFEAGLAALCRGVDAAPPRISLERLAFIRPQRDGLPSLDRYAQLHVAHGELRTVGYTEASRGCKHRCRHCPIVPVYEGKFRVVQRDVVREDIRQQVAAGARHITFGDPDFFNGPTHAIAVVETLHRDFPELTYDVTVKVEHLLRHREQLPVLRDTGCLFVTTAVEAVDDRTLGKLDKGHTREELLQAIALSRQVGLPLNPTFVTFSPWTTLEGYVDLLEFLLEQELVDAVSPIQYGIRLLIPRASRLLELPEVEALVGPFDEAQLVYPWSHADPRVDRLHATVLEAIQEGQRAHEDRRQIFRRVWKLALAEIDASSARAAGIAVLDQAPPRATVPYLTEPWYC